MLNASIRRSAATLAFLFLAVSATWTPAAAAETYIVPVLSAIQAGAPPFWLSHVTITNPHPFPVVAHVTGIYSYGTDDRCPELRELTLAAYESRALGAGCMDSMSAVAFTSDVRLGVASEVSLYVRQQPEDYDREISRETIDAGREWLDAGSEHVIPLVTVVPDSVRANLFLINPGDADIHVEYQRVADNANPIRTVTVEAHSARWLALPADPIWCASGDVAIPDCTTPLRVTADGTFYAAVSLVENQTGMARFRSPVK